MMCDAVLDYIPLYFYGELAPVEEDQLEEHLHSCPSCAREMERQRAFAAALSGRQIDPSPTFLDDCRQDLAAAMEGAGSRRIASRRQSRRSSPGQWRLFLAALADSFSGNGQSFGFE